MSVCRRRYFQRSILELQKSAQKWSQNGSKTGAKMGPGRPPEAPQKATWGPCVVPGAPAGSCSKPVFVVGVGFVLVCCFGFVLFWCLLLLLFFVCVVCLCVCLFFVFAFCFLLFCFVFCFILSTSRCSKTALRCSRTTRPDASPKMPQDGLTMTPTRSKTPPRRPKTTKQCEHH